MFSYRLSKCKVDLSRPRDNFIYLLEIISKEGTTGSPLNMMLLKVRNLMYSLVIRESIVLST